MPARLCRPHVPVGIHRVGQHEQEHTKVAVIADNTPGAVPPPPAPAVHGSSCRTSRTPCATRPPTAPSPSQRVRRDRRRRHTPTREGLHVADQPRLPHPPIAVQPIAHRCLSEPTRSLRVGLLRRPPGRRTQVVVPFNSSYTPFVFDGTLSYSLSPFCAPENYRSSGLTRWGNPKCRSPKSSILRLPPSSVWGC
jgi:hypothetical protein